MGEEAQSLNWIQVGGAAIKGLREFFKPLALWYGAYIFFEICGQAALMGSLGAASSWLTVLSLFTSLLSLFAHFGFLGFAFLAAGKIRGLLSEVSFQSTPWLKDYILENLKAILYSLPWFFLLIVPGLVRLIRYSLVSAVVMLEPGYQRDEVDALKTSLLYSKGVFWQLTWLFILVMGGSALAGHYSFADSWVGYFALAHLVEFLIYIYWVFATTEIFVRQKGIKHESGQQAAGSF